MLPTETHRRGDNALRSSGLLMPGLLSIALLAILFRLPQPAIQVNQPFKVELFLSVFLAVLFVLIGHDRKAEFRRENFTSLTIAIAAAIGGFVLWSLASFGRASSFGSVAHHTL